jgi:hypothetical protein
MPSSSYCLFNRTPSAACSTFFIAASLSQLYYSFSLPVQPCPRSASSNCTSPRRLPPAPCSTVPLPLPVQRCPSAMALLLLPSSNCTSHATSLLLPLYSFLLLPHTPLHLPPAALLNCISPRRLSPVACSMHHSTTLNAPFNYAAFFQLCLFLTVFCATGIYKRPTLTAEQEYEDDAGRSCCDDEPSFVVAVVVVAVARLFPPPHRSTGRSLPSKRARSNS